MTDNHSSESISSSIDRRWGKYRPPTRKFVVWGWDEKGDPSFAIFLGRHEFEGGNNIYLGEEQIQAYHQSFKKELKPEISPGTYRILNRYVQYTAYTILRGNGGHLPSHKDFKVLYPSYYDYRTRKTVVEPSYLVNKKGLYRQYSNQVRRTYYRRSRSVKLQEAASLKLLDSTNQFSLPFYKELSYQDYIKELKGKDIFERTFTIAEDPNDVLKLDESLKEYLDLMIEILSNQKLYKRKKHLNTLLDKKPPKLVYDKLLEIGSSELISGLLLELAKREDPVLKEDIKDMLRSGIEWDGPKYGAKRCARIYLNSVIYSRKQQRVKEIYDTMSKIDIIAIDGYRPGGKRWRYLKKKERDTSYNDYVKTWGRDEWEAIGPTLRFGQESLGQLNHIKFKSLIQEVEVYSLYDVLGILACLVDSPKYFYFMKQSGYFGYYIYIRRLIRRIIDNYAKTKEDAFIEVIKSFFHNYKTNDTISGYNIPKHINNILRHFILEPEIRYSSRYDRYSYRSRQIKSTDFKNKRSVKDYQNRIEILKRHLKDVVEIAAHSEEPGILHFCFEIIKDHPNLDDVLNKISYQDLIQLSISPNYNLANLFREKFSDLLSKSSEFNHLLMIALMESPDTKLHEQALEYYKRTNGEFTPEMVVDLLLLKNIDDWVNFIEDRLKGLKDGKYLEFVNYLINTIYLFLKQKIVLPEVIFDRLNELTKNINQFSFEDKDNLIKLVLDIMMHEPKLSEWISTYFQNIVFSVSYDDLVKIVTEIGVDKSERFPSRVVHYLIKAIITSKVPSNTEILDILELGSSKMVRTLITNVERN
ncbi:MAG: hypothetical protein ACFFCM_20800, partial [Promethearchaeota archaeon]